MSSNSSNLPHLSLSKRTSEMAGLDSHEDAELVICAQTTPPEPPSERRRIQPRYEEHGDEDDDGEDAQPEEKPPADEEHVAEEQAIDDDDEEHDDDEHQDFDVDYWHWRNEALALRMENNDLKAEFKKYEPKKKYSKNKTDLITIICDEIVTQHWRKLSFCDVELAHSSNNLAKQAHLMLFEMIPTVEEVHLFVENPNIHFGFKFKLAKFAVERHENLKCYYEGDNRIYASDARKKFLDLLPSVDELASSIRALNTGKRNSHPSLTNSL